MRLPPRAPAEMRPASSMPEVSLRPIDDSHRRACLSLGVADSQDAFITPNSKSLKQAPANPVHAARAIYVDDELVGFLMLEPRGKRETSIDRIMID